MNELKIKLIGLGFVEKINDNSIWYELEVPIKNDEPYIISVCNKGTDNNLFLFTTIKWDLKWIPIIPYPKTFNDILKIFDFIKSLQNEANKSNN